MNKRKDITGKKFGRLTAIRFDHSEKHHSFWLYRCECGNEVVRRTDHTTNIPNASCGCYMDKIMKKAQKIHSQEIETKRIKNELCINNKTELPLYKRYSRMIERCYNKSHPSYKYYGERGISVCFEWKGKQGFYNFYAWAIRNNFEPSLTLDRIDVNGNYCPENCRWVNMDIQGNNRRNNHYYEYNGESLTLSQISRKYNVNYNMMYSRINKHHMSIEEAISDIKNGEM